MILSARRFAAVAALALLASPALAQTQTPAPAIPEQQLKVAREVVEASGVAGSVRNIVPLILDEAKRTFVQTRPDLSTDLDAVVRILQPEFERRQDQLMNDIATVYAQRFTTQELTEIGAFYGTPTGRKLVSVLPSVLQASSDRVRGWTAQMSRDVVTRMRQEMKKKGRDI
jgi:hypothetical protein